MINIIILIILLIFSFILSGTETAYFSLEESDIRRFLKSPAAYVNTLRSINRKRTEFLISLLFLNTFVNVFFVSIFNSMFVFGNKFISIIIVTLLLLIAGEITPKIISVYKPHVFLIMLPFTNIFHVVVYPLSAFFALILGKRKNEPSKRLNYMELRDMLAYIRSNYKDNRDEVELVENYLSLREMNVMDISVKKQDIVSIKSDASFRDASSVFLNHRFSRMPVISKRGDRIVGIIYFKDMLFVERDATIKGIIRNVSFISDETPVFKLLSWFLKTKNHIAVIQNKNGITAGLVTLNDIMERLLGPLPDDRGTADDN